MIETLASQTTPANPLAPTEETLRLKCPRCGGGLNLKRRHLGLKGQCVHCHSTLAALEENGDIRVVCDEMAVVAESQPAPEASPDTVEPAGAPFPVAYEPAREPTPAPEVAPLADLGKEWTLPDFGDLSTITPPAMAPSTEAVARSAHAPSTGYRASLPTREDDNLFQGRPESLEAPSPRSEAKAEPSPFGGSEGFSLSFPPMFGGNEETGSISPAWGTHVPHEAHASISPFGTGSTEGGGFAEDLFRKKVAKDASAKSDSSPIAPANETAPDGVIPKRVGDEKVILDGDGRPLRAMTEEEKASFTTHFFKPENTCFKSHRVSRLMRKLVRPLIGFCVLGAIGGIAAFFTPKEKLAEIKEDAIEWLKPGMAILDYLPDSLRPEWLPRTEFGIDAGVDENGQPKKKLNALEGLDKLKGDVGGIRSAADDELKKLNGM